MKPSGVRYLFYFTNEMPNILCIHRFPLTIKNRYATVRTTSVTDSQNQYLLTESLVTFPYEFNLWEPT